MRSCRPYETERARVEFAPAGLVGIPKAAGKLMTASTKIVRLILDGRLSRTCGLADVPGYAGLLVDPEEMRPLVKQPVDWISLNQAFGELRVTPPDRQGARGRQARRRVLRTTKVSNAKVPGSHPRVKLANLDAFRATYATHGDLCRDHGLHYTEVTRRTGGGQRRGGGELGADRHPPLLETRSRRLDLLSLRDRFARAAILAAFSWARDGQTMRVEWSSPPPRKHFTHQISVA